MIDDVKKQIKHIVVEEFEGIDDVKLYEDRSITFKNEETKTQDKKEEKVAKTKKKKKNKNKK